MENLFSNRLKIALDTSRMTPEQLAKKTNLDENNILYYLSGKLKPNTINIKKMAEVLNVNETWLRGNDTDPFGDNLFSHNLKYLLDSNRITVKQLLDITGMKSPSVVTMWKNNERQISTKNVILIANYLNITADDLVNKDLIVEKPSCDEIETLYSKNKDILTDSDKAIIKTIIEQRIKEKGE